MLHKKADFADVDGADSRLLIAEKDIVCYKFLERMEHTDYDESLTTRILRWIGIKPERKSTYSYVTPYQCTDVVIGETYTSHLVLEYGCVEIGLHSFANEKDALSKSKKIVQRLPIVIVRCIIPKGSEYCVGTFDVFVSYASSALTYLEIVETITNKKD